MTAVDPRPRTVMGYPVPTPDPGAPAWQPVARAEVTFVRCDDWVGVYINGELKQEGHSIQEDDLVRSMGHRLNVRWWDNDKAVESWFENNGHCPSTLKELDEACL